MKRSVLYLLHGFVLLLFAGLGVMSAGSTANYYKVSYLSGLLQSGLFFGLMLGIVYLSYGLFIPKFLVRKQYARFAAGVSGIIVAGACARYLFMLLVNLLSSSAVQVAAPTWGSIFICSITMGMTGTFFRLYVEWLKDVYNKAEQQKQQFKSELALLKNQLNPHFLFNTLNNIDSLILEGSGKASSALNKLSEIMRYVVYDSEKDLVPLQDEIGYIQNYISLQKMRLLNEEVIQFSINGEAGNKEIAPMLFMPFIENSFKHSSLKDAAQNKIEVRIDISEHEISLFCLNRIASIEKDSTKGVGLGIVKKRLDLLYKENYQLKIDRPEHYFMVNLSINCN